MKYRVLVQIKGGVLDPEMATLQRLLSRSGVKDIEQVTHRHIFELDFKEGVDAAEAEATAKKIAADVLVNPEIQEWTLERV